MTTRFKKELSFDGSRYSSARLSRVERPRDEEELRGILLAARKAGLRIAVKGGGFSQGGLLLDESCVQIDTARLNRIIDIDQVRRTTRVQTGVTWDHLRVAFNPLGL